MDAISLARLLIDIPSVTGDESRVGSEIERIAESFGFSCSRQAVSENRFNLFINWDSIADVVFCSHLDTVPPYHSFSMDSSYIYGRGACDTKGIISAMLIAGKELHALGEHVAFLFVVGEETNSIGAKIAITTDHKAHFIIVGEPTENLLAIGHKGVLSYTLKCKGTPAHSAYPTMGNSAIHQLLDLISDIRYRSWGEDAVLGKATLNVGMIDGGTAANVFAETASATVVHRIVDSLAQRKQQIINIVADTADITFHSQNDPQFLYVPPGFETTVVAFGTDVPYLRSMGTPLLVGPGSIHDAHTENEKISIAQIHDAVELYKKVFFALKDEIKRNRHA